MKANESDEREKRVKRVENKTVQGGRYQGRYFFCFCTVKLCSKSFLFFTVLLNTLLFVIMSRKQAIDHLHIYSIIPGSVTKVRAD